MDALTIVKYSHPQPGEEALRFLLREDNGDRLLIQLLCDWAVPPCECVPMAEIVPVSPIACNRPACSHHAANVGALSERRRLFRRGSPPASTIVAADPVSP